MTKITLCFPENNRLWCQLHFWKADYPHER